MRRRDRTAQPLRVVHYSSAVYTLVNRVYCLELNVDAATTAMRRLHELGYANVETRVTDPYYGWPESSRRFDAIIIRLAVEFVPRSVLNQLKAGGRLIAPVGRSNVEQHLTLFTKNAEGRVSETRVMPVRFMRLPGGERI